MQSAASKAAMDGLRTTPEEEEEDEEKRFGFMVSKQMMPSKHPARPSRSNALLACSLSEFVKICGDLGKASLWRASRSSEEDGFVGSFCENIGFDSQSFAGGCSGGGPEAGDCWG